MSTSIPTPIPTSAPTPTQTIAIAGAGLLGRLLAWHLLKLGHPIVLFEAGAMDPSPAAARTAAGMISPLTEAVESNRTIYEMGLVSLALWPQWLQQLQDDCGEIVDFKKNGSLIVAHSQDHSELLQFQKNLLHTIGNEGEYIWQNQEDIQALEPDISHHFQQGLLLANEAHIDNRKLLKVLLGEIERLGGDCREFCPVQVHPGKVISDTKTESFDLVLDCRGLGAKHQWQGLRGIRGEVMGVQTKDIRLNRPVRLMHPRYTLYVVPKANHCFVIGATQIESEDRSPVTLQSSLELSSALYTLSPAFAEANIVDMGVNLRPGFMDNQPRITQEDGLIRANGLFRHGFLLAPVLVSHVLALIGGGDLPFAEHLGLIHDNTRG